MWVCYPGMRFASSGLRLLERSQAIGAFGKPIDMVDVYFQVEAALKKGKESVIEGAQVGTQMLPKIQSLIKATNGARSGKVGSCDG